MIRAVSVLAQMGTPEANKALLAAAETPFFLLPMGANKQSRESFKVQRAFGQALRALETNGTPEARQILKLIANSSLDDYATRGANEALRRLGADKESHR